MKYLSLTLMLVGVVSTAFSLPNDSQSEDSTNAMQITREEKSVENTTNQQSPTSNIYFEKLTQKKAKYLLLAEQGDINAQYMLGVIFNGVGPEKNLPEAFKWFERAAQAGDARSQQNVAIAYAWGRGVPKDLVLASKWFNQTRESYLRDANDPHNKGVIAAFELGEIYSRGLGVPKNEEMAFSWYSKAANKGYPWAEERLGEAYQKGLGVPIDTVQALNWYQKAADAKNATAQYKIASLIKENDPQRAESIITQETAKVISEEEARGAGSECRIGDLYRSGIRLPKDTAEAAKWYQKAVEKGDPQGAIKISWMYRIGIGCGKNPSQEFFWRKKAAEMGDVESQLQVAMNYLSGQYCTQSYSEAFKWYSKAAESGNEMAMSQLGWMYIEGHGVDSNPAEGAKWLKKSAEKGSARSGIDLKRMIDQGDIEELHGDQEGSFQIGTNYFFNRAAHIANGDSRNKPDLAEALKWYLKAADRGNDRAMWLLGEWYYQGKSQDGHEIVKENGKEAAKWFSMAADHGNAYAAFQLGTLYTQRNLHGASLERNIPEGIKWYQKAVDLNHSPDSWMAAQNLSALYRAGSGGQSDPALVLYWLEKSAALGSSSAAREVSNIYQKGRGVRVNLEAAAKWKEWAEELEKKVSPNSSNTM